VEPEGLFPFLYELVITQDLLILLNTLHFIIHYFSNFSICIRFMVCLIEAVSNSAYIVSNNTVIGDYWIGNDWRKRSWSKLRYCVGICLRGLRKTMKATVRVAGFPAGNRTGHLFSTSQKRCGLSQLARHVLILFFNFHSPKCSLLLCLSADSVLQFSNLNVEAFNNFNKKIFLNRLNAKCNFSSYFSSWKEPWWRPSYTF
jgi:hypothetical protein